MKLESIVRICRDLNTAGVRYLVTGGMAVVAHGFARLTMDLDMIINLTPDNTRTALNVFAGLGYFPRVPVDLGDFADETLRHQWIQEKNMVVFSLINPDSSFPVIDLFVEEPFDFKEEYQRAEAVKIDSETEMPVVSVSMLIAMKIKAGREKDHADIEALKQLQMGQDDEENRRA